MDILVKMESFQILQNILTVKYTLLTTYTYGLFINYLVNLVKEWGGESGQKFSNVAYERPIYYFNF